MSKHTEGPWQVGDLVENDHAPRHVTILGSDGVKLIAKVYYGKTEECAENAHLMAAAPELLRHFHLLLELSEKNDYAVYRAAVKEIANSAINEAGG